MLIYHLLRSPAAPGKQWREQNYTVATQLLLCFPPLLQGAPSPAQCYLSDILLLLTHTCWGSYDSLTLIRSTGTIPNICQNLSGGILVWAGDVLHPRRISDFPHLSLLQTDRNRRMGSGLQISFKRTHLVFCVLSLLGNIQQELLYPWKCYQDLTVLSTVKKQS